MEHKLGERFEFCGATIEVKERKDFVCHPNCHFINFCLSVPNEAADFIGSCYANYREDGKNVYFEGVY